ncbi:MAG: Exocyst complex component 2, partial [Paramarteilia canceri]
ADCFYTAKWISSTEVHAITNKKVRTTGDIIITTLSHNYGRSEVQFTGYLPEINHLTEVGCWVEENFTLIQEEKVEEIDDEAIISVEKSSYPFPVESLNGYSNIFIFLSKSKTI